MEKLEELNSRVDGLTWTVSGASRYESDWMAMHRFLWMNAISYGAIWREIGEVRNGRRIAVAGTPAFMERFAVQLHDSTLTSKFAEHFRGRSLVASFGGGTGNAMRETESVRFCPACLADCFHSWLFQLANVARCPFHGCELQCACLSCGRKIGTPRFTLPDFRHPLACRSCGDSFLLGDDWGVAFSGPRQAEVEFEEVESWMSNVRRIQFDKLLSLGGAPSPPKDYEAICTGLSTICGKPFGADLWLNVSHKLSPVKTSGDYQDPALRKFCKDNLSKSLQPDIETACAIAKSINRNISRIIRGICGHRSTANLQWENAARPFCRLEATLYVSPLDCPCCAVLDQWRAYAGKLLALRDRVRARGGKAFELYEGDIRGTFSLEPNTCADALLSSFTWFVVSLYRTIRIFCNQEDSFWYAGDKQFSLKRERESQLLLDVYRLHLATHCYSYSAPSGPVALKYSLGYARDCLLSLYQVYKRGEYWLGMQSDASPALKFGRTERWYVQMSTYLQTRPGNPELLGDPSGTSEYQAALRQAQNQT